MTYARSTLLASLMTLGLAGGCDIGDGGANDGQQQPGNGDDGVALRAGNIAVAPHGTSFLARIDRDLVHGDVDGSWRKLSQLEDPERMVFSPERDVIYVITGGPNRLRAHDLSNDAQLWSAHVPGGEDYLWDWGTADDRPWLHVTSDDRHLAVITHDEVTLYDAQTGETVDTWRAGREIVDFDLDPSGDAAYVTLSHEWVDEGPVTPFVTLDLPSLETRETPLPNCADETVMDTDGRYAFMAPTRCEQDPVSVIDLRTGAFVRNLPGFGPVSLAASGDVAVAFMDLENLDESLFLPGDPTPEGDRRYHLMLIDTKTLEFESVELGDSLPRYAPTPDGKLLLVDANAWYDDERVRVFDLASGEIESVLGPDIRLENFVMTADSQYAYLVDDGAYELSIGERILSSLPLSIIPTNLNLTSDDRWLLLQDDLGPVHVYDRNQRRVSAVVGAERTD
ncbi:MAG: YncE family protein [Nannocystaceae bacterium]|nr:hypothetical protein [bacterium]